MNAALAFRAIKQYAKSGTQSKDVATSGNEHRVWSSAGPLSESFIDMGTDQTHSGTNRRLFSKTRIGKT